MDKNNFVIKHNASKRDTGVSVVIPNWNGVKYLPLCLDSLRKQTFKNFNVILVDNNSSDNSAKLVQENFPEVTIIRLNTNKGFTGAVNEGIRYSRREYVALLNTDVEVTETWLEEMQKTLYNNSHIGFCACKMLISHYRNIINSAGDGLTSYGRPCMMGFLEEDKGQYSASREVFGACGAAAMYRRSLFDEIGLFDEDFFMFMEDIDIDFRAQLKGFKCLYVPTAICFHVGGASAGGRQSPLVIRYVAQNSINNLIKNMPKKFLIKNAGYILFDFLHQQIVQLLKYKKNGIYFFLGILHSLLHMFRMLKKRKRIQSTIKIDVEQLNEFLKEADREIKLCKQRRKMIFKTDTKKIFQ